MSMVLPLTLLTFPATAAPTLEEIQGRVTILQEEAAAAAEGAQAAKVQLAQLNKTLSGIKQEAAVQGQTVDQLRKVLGSIAIEQYKSGGISQSLELLFSSNPTLYLSAAGSLESLTRRKAHELNKFAAAQQRLSATTMTVNDKLTLVAATQTRLTKQAAQAQSKLKEAEAILAKLKKADRERLAALALARENADQASSLALAKKANGISGRAGVALKFALKQIGDRYVFGAAGMTYWDCSGLTMRALQVAGVSLPHSAAAQTHFGKYVPLNALKAGDLVFFGSPISHVGIYMGSHRMVHAPRPGSRVKVAEFGMAIGSKRLVAARRF
ncbi:MAG: peptidoglycan endopeptidase [Actinobacteria bacterium]|nr:peptidoglycan endopeptidase [Actinomycetota bacterium]MSW23137.1 peptidoglycan endopeptidase [Actinomycetota bacterium]MSW75171.1 peptidoglycan endopeptidase [Actinomycetota bacterium]MSY30646.1 peptidoglycan endopeptidase [Actinomycetota bacterium]